MNKILSIWEKWCKYGVYLPYAHDPISKKPSITLLFPYITFVIALISIISLHFEPKLVIATTTSIIFWAISVIFYMLRKLSKAKFDLDDKSFELESQDGEKDEENIITD